MKTLKEIKEIICLLDNLRERFMLCENLEWEKINAKVRYIPFTDIDNLVISENLECFSVQDGNECKIAVIER